MHHMSLFKMMLPNIGGYWGLSITYIVTQHQAKVTVTEYFSLFTNVYDEQGILLHHCQLYIAEVTKSNQKKKKKSSM